MTSPYRVGIVGSGFGGTVHAPAFAAHPAFELVAIASPNNAARVAAERKIPQAFTSTEEMLARAELDVVSIAGPPETHHPAAVAAFERKLHVLCEKPFAVNCTQAREMAAAARNAGRIGALCHEFRFLPARQAFFELIANGHLGPLREIEITMVSGFLKRDAHKARSWWFEKQRGGGITGAWLSHSADMACWLAGRPPLHTSGFSRTANPERRDENGAFRSDVADGAFALLDFGDGLIARLTVDGTSAVESYICGVHGEARTAIASGTSIFTERLYAVDDDETSELETPVLPQHALSAANPLLPSFISMLDGFAALLAGKPSHVATFDDGVVTQTVLAAAGYE